MKSKFNSIYIKESENMEFDKVYNYADIYYKMKWGQIKYNEDEENNEDIGCPKKFEHLYL